MIHTFELFRMLSKDKYERIAATPGMRYYQRCWVSDKYQGVGISKIRLYKWMRRETRGTVVSVDSDMTHYYMVSVTVNPSAMFGGDPNHAMSITAFGEDFVAAIYRNIYEVLPCLEQCPGCYEGESRDRQIWKEANLYSDTAFVAGRIDYTFDLKRNGRLYLKLIERGYSLRGKKYERCYYPVKNNNQDSALDVDNMTDDEDDVPPQNVYYKSSAKHPSLKINIYHKQTELKNRNLPGADIADYDFLRIEVQALKGKLSDIKEKIGAPKRQLIYLATPEAETYILENYVTVLTGKGQVYVSGIEAKKAIDAKGYKADKTAKLKAVIDAVANKHGISKVIKSIEAGEINDLGKVSSFKRYLRILEDEVGINPVTISQNDKGSADIYFDRKGQPKLQKGAVVNLTEYIRAYSQSVIDEIQSLEQEYQDVTGI